MKKLFLVVFLLFLFPLINATTFGYNTLDNQITFNNATGSVNNSIYWDGNAWSDTRWLDIDGGNANTNIDIGSYNFSADWLDATNGIILNGYIISNWSDISGTSYWQRVGTVLSPLTAGDDITTTGTGTFGIAKVGSATWDISDRLKGQWHLNDNLADTVVIDSSGEGHTGTLYGGDNTADIHAEGKVGTGSLNFDGTADYAEADFSDVQTKGSISLWVNPDSITGIHYFVSLNEPTGNNRWLVYSNGGNMALWGASAGTGRDVWSKADVLEIGYWYHIVATFDSTTDDYNIYVNGILLTPTVLLTVGNPSGLTKATIGARYGHASFADGKIDEVNVYDDILTQTEVTGLYNSGLGTEDTSGTGGGVINYDSTNDRIVFQNDIIVEKPGEATITATSTNHQPPNFALMRTGNAYYDWRWRNDGGNLISQYSTDDGVNWNDALTIQYTGVLAYTGLLEVTRDTFPVVKFTRANPSHTSDRWVAELYAHETGGVYHEGYSGNFLFAVDNSAGQESGAGLFGGGLWDYTDGVEKGFIRFSPLYHTDIAPGIAYPSGKMELRTLTASTSEMVLTDMQLRIANDSQKLMFGNPSSASIEYDGTDLQINPQVVGTGIVNVSGQLNASDVCLTDGTCLSSGGGIWTDVGGVATYYGDTNITGNATFDGGAIFKGAILGDETLGYENIRYGVYAHTPRIIFDNGTFVGQIDYVGDTIRFILNDSGTNRATLRVNNSAVRIGEQNYRRNLIVWGDIITKDPAGGGGNLIIDGNLTTEDGGKLWSNATCTFLSSPDGSNVQEICNT